MRLIYFLYFLIKADYKKVWQSIRCQQNNFSPVRLFFDAVACSFIYGTSLNDYFNFRFFEKNKKERSTFASTLFMYKFHKALNQKDYLSRVDNKEEFRKIYSSVAGPSKVFNVNNPSGVSQLSEWIASNNIKEIVVKDPLGTTGKSIGFFSVDPSTKKFRNKASEFSTGSFFNQFAINGRLYIEPRLRQHPLINEISPTAINTIRVVTVLKNDQTVDIVAAVFRIAITGDIDNYSAGNIAAPIDPLTGIVIGPGRKKMGACSPLFIYHPITNKPIEGFKVPLWDDVLVICKKAALITPEARTVGWDVAVLNDRAVIIEGNSKWNKDTPQIPLSKGIKPILQQYL